MIKKIMWAMFRAVNFIMPKKDSKVIFTSRPDYADNALAFYQYLSSSQPAMELVWIVNSVDKLKQLREAKVSVFLKRSFMGLLHFMTAKYIAETHGQFVDLKCRRQFLVELWHGKSVKGTGFLDNRERGAHLTSQARYPKAIDAFISGSGITRALIAAGFGLNPHKVLITGQPRNDKLFRQDNNLAKALELSDEELGAFNKVILFVPTFRQRKGYTEGRGFNKEHVFTFPDYETGVFTDFLGKEKILLVLKMHPTEEHLFEEESLVLPGNVKLLTNQKLSGKLLDLYDCLNEIDLLITDYSSIYFDYLLLKRPIIFIPTDFREYAETRGYALEPYDFWAPGPKVFTLAELMAEIGRFSVNPEYYSEQRNTVNMLINKYCDDQASKRIAELTVKRVSMGQAGH